jgi:fluoroquinolone resistance protein
LSAASFDNCDLKGAIFENTIVEKANFQTAYNYSIDPEINHVFNAKFSMPAVFGLLDKYKIIIES